MRTTPAYLDGITLAVNALGGGLAILDCHHCMMERLWMLNAAHDWRAAASENPAHSPERRLFAPTWSGYVRVTGSEPVLRRYVADLAARRPEGPILLCPSWLTNLMGTDLEGIAAELSRETGRAVIAVPRASTDDDWIDGIRQLQGAVLRHLTDPEGSLEPLVTGFCALRLEGDETGNVRELQRLWDATGLPEARWFFVGEPENWRRLSPRAPRLTFPLGSDAVGGGVPGQTVHFSRLPIGVAGTSEFVRRAASLFGREAQGEIVLAAETARLGPLLQPIVANVLSGQGAVVIGDPWTARGLASALRELAIDVPLLVALRRPDANDVGRETLGEEATEVWVDPDHEDLERWLSEQSGRGLCDVVVGSAVARDAAARAGLPYVEVGAPHQLQHFAAPTPYMGFTGMLCLADRLVNATMEASYLRDLRRSRALSEASTSQRAPAKPR